MVYQEIPASIEKLMNEVTEKATENPRWAENFNASFSNTLLTTVKKQADGTTFLLTGDIPAMWLRDSTAQVRPYLLVAKEDSGISDMIAGVVERQLQYVNLDPYANAFNEEANNAGHQVDHTEMNPWIWERKYEIDSLCYPIQLSYLLYKETGRTDQFNETFKEAVKKILALWKVEQNHENSPYNFERDTWREEDTLVNDGKGSPIGVTGMTWSGFRPSDDRCIYNYLVPSNMFAVVVLDYLKEVYMEILKDSAIVDEITALREEIQSGIEKFAKVKNAAGETVYAYEVDGLGNYSIMDDSNVPSLLAAPYLGYCAEDDEVYLATRKTILSKENPYFYEGDCAKGIGSSHTPENYVWPIALAMEGLTTSDKNEKKRILDLLVENDAGTKLMHEGFDVNNPNNYTREWFSWANMMFCELLLDYYGLRIKK
ncbi:glycoside hydrolase family 125 protein [Carnobacterium mobile]|uniref:glycoside hydrolase family 125 protein n=1 Tax=Carnobacterium mobile TaxID=2750 RepID=UPI00054FE3B1|nr:glycoside hydrolase family 125 protein [Carnobacterium mobile]